MEETKTGFDYSKEPGKTLEKQLHTLPAREDWRPAVSIVTPYYNSDANLEQTFQCVMNQTMEDFEWIIVNDGSTKPEAVRKLEEIASRDTRIRILHQENGGQSKAKNHGVREARADLVAFLDADDLIEPFYLELLLQALKQHPSATWAYTDLVGFGAWEYMWVKPFSAGRETFNNTLVNAAVFRKEALMDIGIFDEVYKHYDEDWALYLKLLGRSYHPVHVPVIGFWYRRSDSGMQQTVRHDDTLRQESDAYMAKLAQTVDRRARGEEFCGELPQGAVKTSYSKKERILTSVMNTSLGLALIKKAYCKKS